MKNTGIKPSLVLGLPERSGFLLPALTIWTATIVYFLARKRGKGIGELMPLMKDSNLAGTLGLALLAIYTIFVMGHLVDLLSNGFNERFLANKMNGYPHERIVPIECTTESFKKHLNKKKTIIHRVSFFFEGAKLLISSTFTFTLLTLLDRHPKFTRIPFAHETLVFLINYSLSMMVVASVFALPSLAVRYLPWKTRTEREWSIRLFSRYYQRRLKSWPLFGLISFSWKFLATVLLGPFIYAYDGVSNIVAGMTRVNTRIDEQTFTKAKKVFKNLVKIEYTAIQNNDRFWLAYLSTEIRSPQVIAKIEKTRNIANFCRNQSFACFVSALIFTAVFSKTMPDELGIFNRHDFANLSIAMLITSWLFHWKFLHHYYSYSKMLMRAIALLDSTVKVKKSKKRGLHNNGANGPT